MTTEEYQTVIGVFVRDALPALCVMFSAAFGIYMGSLPAKMAGRR